MSRTAIYLTDGSAKIVPASSATKGRHRFAAREMSKDGFHCGLFLIQVNCSLLVYCSSGKTPHMPVIKCLLAATCRHSSPCSTKTRNMSQ